MVGKVELKDLVKEVLGEIQESEKNSGKTEYELQKVKEIQEIFNETTQEEDNIQDESDINIVSNLEDNEDTTVVNSEEKIFLESLRERLLVLFEGFNSPNNRSVEAKVDMTLNFLELILAKIEDRLEKIDDSK